MKIVSSLITSDVLITSSAAICSFPISEVMKTQRLHRENEGQCALLPEMWRHLSHDLETAVSSDDSLTLRDSLMRVMRVTQADAYRE